MSAAAINVDSLTAAQIAQIYRRALAITPRTHLYAIQHGDGGPVKIGLARHPAQRLSELQIGNPVTLNGLAAWRCLPGDEADLHARFDAAHIRGEWFWPTPDLLAYVLRQGGDWEDWA